MTTKIPAVFICAALCLLVSPARAATNDVTSALQRGLFEEEANQNLGAAIQAYATVANQFDKDRKLAATAIFRLGECYRKQGNTNDAATQYERILREFSDQPTLVTLSRQSLAAVGSAPPAPTTAVLPDTARQEQKRLLEEEIKLVEKQLESQQKQVQVGVIPPDGLVPTQRDLLKLKRQVAALDAGQPVSLAAAETTASAAEAKGVALEAQIAELKALPKDKLRIVVQQNFPNPVLTSLMQKRTEAEQKLAELQKEYGPEHGEVQKTLALRETIDKQIDEQVQSVLRYLEIKRTAARKTADILLAQSATSASPAKNPASGSTPLAATSTEAEEVKRIQALIKDSPDLINAPDQKGETLLQAAAAKAKLAVVKLLLDSGAAVDGLQQPGLTALHYAAANGHKAIVDLLLSKGAKAEAQTEGGLTPLHLAALKGYESVAKALLAAGAPVNAETKRGAKGDTEDLQYRIGSDLTPLHLAADGGYASLVELLLAKGADMNTGSKTPLSYAVRFEAVARLLLAAHADPNAGSHDLPLGEAAYFGNMTVHKLLLANGANPNTNSTVSWRVRIRTGFELASNTRFTPLFLAVTVHRVDAVEELLRAKADPNLPGPDGQSLLFEALSDAPTFKALLEGGADPNVRISGGQPLLMQAVIDKNQPAVELLLAHHAAASIARTDDGWTPLHAAAALGNKPIAELLLKGGAAVNAQGKNGETPLWVAVDHKQPELAELLLANKADPNERDNSGHTALDVAKSQGQSTPGRPLGGSPGYPGMSVAVPVARPQGLMPGSPATAPAQESKPEAMADLLRQHGAVDDLPQLDGIRVRRHSAEDAAMAFKRGAHDWGQFTLLDFLGVEYSFLAASPQDGGGDAYDRSAFFNTFSGLSFPDLAHLRIRRPGPDQKSWQEQVVDLRPILESGDCSKDVGLEWGDVVEIPEADHPLNEKWPGFSKTELANLKRCLTRRIEIVINGQATNITLAPRIYKIGEEAQAADAAPMPQHYGSGGDRRGEVPVIVARTPFWLKPILLQSKLVLTSSDLRHVKVTRHGAASGQEREWVVDCSQASPAPDFWLRDGDKIDVPEKSASALAEEETMAPSSSPGQSFSTRLQNIIQRAPPSAQGLPATPQFSTRLQNIIQRAPASTPAMETTQPAKGEHYTQRLQNIIDRRQYSPKPDDPELLKEGYQRDRSATTRKGETWEERAGADLKGRACPAVWSGTDMIVFGGEGMGTSFDDGARYCFAEDTWAPLPEKGAPSSRTGHALVWTGKEMIIWGGFGGYLGQNTNRNDGARYNPASDTWKPVTTRNAPTARFDFPAVWTGKEMLVWGGYTDAHSRYQGAHADAYLNTGGRYSPSSDTWKAIPTRRAPSRRCFHTLLWTGKEMIVWGGGNANKVLNDGYRYNPAQDSWKPISTDGAPSPRYGHVSVWTGKEMIVWGGSSREASSPSDYFENGARYNPETDTWKPISTIGAPKGRVSVTAVWTGTEMVLWGGVNDAQGGGVNDSGRYIGTGARYNPATDTWTELTVTGAPSPRLTGGVWTGEGLLTFGGYNGTHLNDTWFYSPSRTLYPYVK